LPLKVLLLPQEKKKMPRARGGADQLCHFLVEKRERRRATKRVDQKGEEKKKRST